MCFTSDFAELVFILRKQGRAVTSCPVPQPWFPPLSSSHTISTREINLSAQDIWAWLRFL